MKLKNFYFFSVMFMLFSALLINSSFNTSMINMQETNIKVSIVDEAENETLEDEKLCTVVLGPINEKKKVTDFNTLHMIADTSAYISIFRPPIS